MTKQAQLIKKKVLVVDDEPSVLYSLYRILSEQYVVIEASNGEQAVILAQNHKPDIIFMDMKMPRKDGLTACAEIRANEATKAIPVIMLTGVGYELNKELAPLWGVSGYITKPFTPKELLDTISSFLNNLD